MPWLRDENLLLSQLCIKALKEAWHLTPGDLSSVHLIKSSWCLTSSTEPGKQPNKRAKFILKKKIKQNRVFFKIKPLLQHPAGFIGSVNFSYPSDNRAFAQPVVEHGEQRTPSLPGTQPPAGAIKATSLAEENTRATGTLTSGMLKQRTVCKEQL